MVANTERSFLLERVKSGKNGEIDWLTFNGTTNHRAARAWIKVCTLPVAGQGLAETDLISSLIQDSQTSKLLYPHQPIDMIDLGCGTGEKASRVIQCLHLNGFRDIRYVPVDSIDILVSHAVQTVKNVSSSVHTLPLVMDFTTGISIPHIHLRPRLFLFLGNTFNTFEPEVIVPALKNLMQPEDLLLVGLRYRKSGLYEGDISILTESSPELNAYPSEIAFLLEGYYRFNEIYPVFKAFMAGLDQSNFDHHVAFDCKRSRLERFITVKNIKEDSELREFGFANGQKITYAFTRYETLKTQECEFTAHFKVVQIHTHEDPSKHENIAILALQREKRN